MLTADGQKANSMLLRDWSGRPKATQVFKRALKFRDVLREMIIAASRNASTPTSANTDGCLRRLPKPPPTYSARAIPLISESVRPLSA